MSVWQDAGKVGKKHELMIRYKEVCGVLFRVPGLGCSFKVVMWFVRVCYLVRKMKT